MFSNMANFGVASLFVTMIGGAIMAQSPVPAWAQQESVVAIWTDSFGLDAIPIKGGLVDPSLVYTSAAVLPVREAPPSGWLMQPGDEKSTTQIGDLYAVFGTTQVQRAFSLDDWALVAKVNEVNEIIGDPGWVYFGTAGRSVDSPFVERVALPKQQD